MFNAEMQVHRPDEVQATIKLTAPMKEWKELRDQLADKWPSTDLWRVVNDCVSQIERRVYSDSGE